MAQTQTWDPYNPSAYQAPDLPQIAPPPDPQAQLRVQPAPTPSTYPGKLGSAALIATDIMSGFTNGLARAQMMRAQKLQRTSQALQSSYNLAAKNFADTAQAMNLTPEQLQAFRKVSAGINSAMVPPQMQAALAAKGVAGISPENFATLMKADAPVHGAWNAYMSFLAEHAAPEKSQKGKKKKQQGDQPQQGNFLARIAAAMRGGDPAEVSRELYSLLQSNGAPVYDSLYSTLAQSTQRLAAQKLETSTTQAAQEKADAQIVFDKYAGLSPEEFGKLDPKEQQKFENARAIVEGTGRISGTSRTYVDPDGKEFNGWIRGNEVIDDQGNVHLGAKLKPAGAPHPAKYDTATDTIVGPDGTRYSPNDPNLPPDIASMFTGVKRALQNKAVTTTGIHTVMVPQPDGSTLPVEVETTSTRTPGGAGAPANQAPNAAAPTHTHAGVVGTGQPVGGKKTAAQVDADKQYDNAVGIANLAQSVLTTMGKGNDVETAAAEKLFVGMLQKASEGRFNQGAYDNLAKRYGLGQHFEQAINNLASGKLPDDVARGLIKDSLLILQSAKARKQAAYQPQSPNNEPNQPKTYKQTATDPTNGHQIGSDDGETWYDVKTGAKI